MCGRPLGKGFLSCALIGFFHVSGLLSAALFWLLALMEIRRRGP